MTSDNSDRDRPIGEIRLGLDVGRVDVGQGRACKAIEGPVEAALDDAVDLTLAALSDVFQQTLRDVLAEMPEKMELDREVNDPLAAVVSEFGGPLALAPMIEAERPGVLPRGVAPYLALNPTKVMVATPRIKGTPDGGQILLSPGIVAAPLVTFSKPADAPADFIALETGTPPDDRFEVTVVGKIDLQTAQAVATEQVKAAVNSVFNDRLDYDDLSVSLYQARERVVIGVEVSGLTWLGLRVKVFLTARPEVDDVARVIRLRDVKFDLASSQFLSRVAAFVLESPIEEMIEARVALPLGSALDAVVAEFADMSVDLGPVSGLIATLNLNLDDLSLAGLWVSEGNLNAAVTASGRSRISLE